jgi:high-affinity iron transporter
MFSGLLLSLREGLEAALVVGVVLGSLRQLRRSDCARVVWGALGAAAVVSALAAWLFITLGLGGAASAEPAFEGLTLITAAGLLTWMLFWMQREGRHLRGELDQKVRCAVCQPGRRGIFMLTFVSVAREGIELAFFLVAVSFGHRPASVIGGAALGLATAAGVAWLLFATTVGLNVRRFFQVTGVALLFFAAGLVAKAMQEFNEAGWIPALIDPVWDSGQVLNDGSLLGGIAHILFGYTSTPSLTVVLAYAAYLAAILATAGGPVWRKASGVVRSSQPKLKVLHLPAP